MSEPEPEVRLPLIADLYAHRPEDRRAVEGCWAAWERLKAMRPGQMQKTEASRQRPGLLDGD